MAEVIHSFKWGGRPLGSQIGGVLSGLGNTLKGIGTLLPERQTPNPITMAIAQAFGQMATPPAQAAAPAQPSLDELAYTPERVAQEQAAAQAQPAPATAPASELVTRRLRLMQQLWEAIGTAGGDPETAIQVATLIPDEQLASDVRVIPMSSIAGLDPTLQRGALVISPNGTTQVIQPDSAKPIGDLRVWALEQCISNPDACNPALDLAQRITLATTRDTGGGEPSSLTADIKRWQFLLGQPPEVVEKIAQIEQLFNPQDPAYNEWSFLLDITACAGDPTCMQAARDRQSVTGMLGALGAGATGTGSPAPTAAPTAAPATPEAAAAPPPAVVGVTPAQISSSITHGLRVGASLDAIKAALVRSGADPAAVDAEIARQRGPAVPGP